MRRPPARRRQSTSRTLNCAGSLPRVSYKPTYTTHTTYATHPITCTNRFDHQRCLSCVSCVDCVGCVSCDGESSLPKGSQIMSFEWPAALWGFVVIAALLALYVRILVRPARTPVAWTTVGGARLAAGTGSRFRRHAAAGAFAAPLPLLLLAAARAP